MKNKRDKSIKPILVDVRHPRKANASPVVQKTGYFSRGGWVTETEKLITDPLKIIRRIFFTLFASVAVIVIGYGSFLWAYKDSSVESAKAIYSNLKLVSRNLADLDTAGASGVLDTIISDLNKLKTATSPLKIAPFFKEIPQLLAKTSQVAVILKETSQEVEYLKVNASQIVFGSSGELSALLGRIISNLTDVDDLIKDIRNSAYKFDFIPKDTGGEYLALSSNLSGVLDVLQSVKVLLDRTGETHLLVLFENPTEIRPGGGFVGSYADVVLEKSGIKEIDVNDIYYPERFSDFKIVPPIQLQGITAKWGPQDANWFFDFPRSAKKTIELLEKSSVYVDKGVQFEGVIAINVRLIEDILDTVGGIEIPEYQMTLTSDNFLKQIQEEVETGRDKKPGSNPKRVLKFVAPRLIEKIASADEEARLEVMKSVFARVEKKDIKIYFKDTLRQSLVKRYNVSGEVFSLPADFNGDYLAVVNANIAGGKSDAFVSQRIELNSKIDVSGNINDHLLLSREHSGQKEREWWYRATNNNYVKIFTPPGSVLESLRGNSIKNIYPSVNYAKSGYAIDPDLASVEGTKELLADINASEYRESGKTVFATWFNVEAGKTKTLAVDYVNPKKAIVAPGRNFQLIFEKQSGVESEFAYSIEAPAGFIWKESKSSIFSYEENELPARLVINLTLEKETVLPQ